MGLAVGRWNCGASEHNGSNVKTCILIVGFNSNLKSWNKEMLGGLQEVA